MMRQELIDMTWRAVSRAPSLPIEPEGPSRDEDYDAIIIFTLNERLPHCEFTTCEDLALGVECCETCHTLYPHYEMYLDDLPDGGKAWICCSVRSALRGEKTTPTSEEIDLEEALGGGIRNRDPEEGG